MAENGDNEKMAALEAKICHQIEYYFGDFNLPRDKFLKEQIKLDEGWVPLEIMIKFNRLNRLTTDFNVIVEALSKSKAELMEISEDKTKIRRSPSKPLPEVTDEYKNDVKNRSVYIKGFPTDAALDDIKEWLEDKGQVLNIQMRRTLHKAFKGSIFAVFDSIESAKKFVETPGQKYKDTDLLILFKEDYLTKKIEERKQNKMEAKLRAKQEQEEKQKLAESAEMKSLEEKIGCLLKFSGDLDDQTCREDLHTLFSNHGEIKWIHFVRGAKEGIILFKEKAKEALDKAKEANNGNLQLRNKEVTWEVLEGDVEKEALKKIIEDQQESLNKWKSKGRRFKGKGKGNKAAQAGSAKGRVQFQGKKTKFDSDDERDANGASGAVKRARVATGLRAAAMSDIVEKTLTALPGLFLQNQSVGGPTAAKASFSSRLGGLVRGITALTSKHEEEKLIQQELNNLKATVSAPTTTLKMMKECMVRLIYCEMLGYDASFGYIHAIKLAQQGNLLEKRVGYLAVSLFLHENHELLLLLVNTVVKDLQSTNLVEVCMALTIVSQIFPREMIPAVLPLIEDKLQHSKEIIRRKAVLALYKFYLIAPNQVQHIHVKFRKALCDRDVGVMAASLHIYFRMIKENSSAYKDLTGSFVTILKQVVGGKLPVDFNYHSVPAPWLQIQLLRILGLLGKDDQRTSELMYDVLDESLRRAELNHNVTYAILFECVHTVYSIYPKSELLEKAAKCIGKFVLSPKINLKYLGLKALTYVIQQDPTLALQHQMTIIECLDHPDPIIKRETLELLYRITNAQNITVIVQKMLEYLHQSKEEYIIVNLVGKIAELAEKYAPDNAWFIQTMNAVFSVGGDVMHPDIPNNFLRLLAEGFDDETENQQLRLYAVQSYLTLLDVENVFYPQRFLQVMSWVLGEYSYLLNKETPEEVITKLYKLLMNDSISSETKAWIIAAVTKLTPQAHSSNIVERLIQEFTTSLDTCLRQHAFELKHLHENVKLMKSLLPIDKSCEDMVVDASLSFLDGFVAEELTQGAAPYKPHHQRQEEKLSQEKVLNFEPYGLSFSSSGFTGRQSPAGISLGSDISGNSTETGLKETNGLKLEGIKKLWGKEGYLPKKENKTGDETEAPPVPQESIIMENGDQTVTKKDQSQVLTQSKEEKEKQLLASSLFVGLGSESTINLLGKADTISHKFRRKSKIKETKSEETTTDQNIIRSSFSSSSNVTYEEDYCLDNLQDRGDKELKKFPLSSELLDSESLTELPLVEKISNCRLSTPSLFADNNMEVFHPPQATAASVANEISLASSLLEETSEHIHSDLMEVCSNETISVSSYKIWKDDCLLVVWSVLNKSGLELKSANLEIAPAENFKITEQPGCCLPVIEAESTKNFQYSVQMEKPFAEGNLSGFITYQVMDTHSVQLEFSVNLSLLDFIRPLKISTEDFGKLWLSFANDVKQNVKMSESQAALSSTLKALQQELRLHVVDIIGNEGLLACQLLPSIPCLLHFRVHGDMLALWFRSSCSTLPDYLLYQCQKVMEGS